MRLLLRRRRLLRDGPAQLALGARAGPPSAPPGRPPRRSPGANEASEAAWDGHPHPPRPYTQPSWRQAVRPLMTGLWRRSAVHLPPAGMASPARARPPLRAADTRGPSRAGIQRLAHGLTCSKRKLAISECFSGDTVCQKASGTSASRGVAFTLPTPQPAFDALAATARMSSPGRTLSEPTLGSTGGTGGVRHKQRRARFVPGRLWRPRLPSIVLRRLLGRVRRQRRGEGPRRCDGLGRGAAAATHVRGAAAGGRGPVPERVLRSVPVPVPFAAAAGS